jgi:hypothetical protein
LIRIAPFSAHKLIEQDTAVLHQAIIVCYNFVSVFHYTFSGLCEFNPCTRSFVALPLLDSLATMKVLLKHTKVCH